MGQPWGSWPSARSRRLSLAARAGLESWAVSTDERLRLPPRAEAEAPGLTPLCA